VPEYVKQASQEVLDSDSSIPTTAFADVARRRFPCPTKAATYISWMYFLEKKSEMSVKSAELIESRLHNFAHRWGIANDVMVLQQKHAAATKGVMGDLPDSTFAIVWADDRGRKDRYLPLRNATEVKVAASWFNEHRDEFRFDDRQTIANKILDKAAAFGAGLGESLDDMLEKQAGRGVYVPTEVAEMLENRVRAVQRCPEVVKDRMQKLASQVSSNPVLAIDPATSANLCRTVDTFDRSFGLVGKYSNLVPRPEDVIFKGTLKVAGQFVKNACTLITGSIYEKEQFEKLSLSEVRGLLGDEIVDHVADGLEVDPEKMAEVASTLPRPDAQKLEILMSDVGETPVIKQATAAGMSQADQAGLAEVQGFLDGLSP
jgi:hypothetical protein